MPSLPTTWYHKTDNPELLKAALSGAARSPALAPFIHLGTLEQARMRAALPSSMGIIRFQVGEDTLRRLRRMRDTGDWRPRRFAQMERQGIPGVIYLNRYEGIPLSEFTAAGSRCRNIDELPDAEFRRRLPSATDSIVIFDPFDLRMDGVAWTPPEKAMEVPDMDRPGVPAPMGNLVPVF